MIKPSIGRKVWYRPSAFDKAGTFGMQQYGDDPLDATIIAVWGDRMVNLHVVDHSGKTFTVTSADLLQDDDKPPVDVDGNNAGRYAEWMPYQVGQSKAAQTVTEGTAFAREVTAADPAQPRPV